MSWLPQCYVYFKFKSIVEVLGRSSSFIASSDMKWNYQRAEIIAEMFDFRRFLAEYENTLFTVYMKMQIMFEFR